MHTSAPAVASRRVTAPPMPREPPVMTARRPFRLKGESGVASLWAISAPGDLVVYHLADGMLDVQLDLLGAIGAVGGHDDAMVHHGRQRAAALGAERERGDSLLARGAGGLAQVAGVAAGGVHDEQVVGRAERLHLPREDLVEREVVADR